MDGRSHDAPHVNSDDWLHRCSRVRNIHISTIDDQGVKQETVMEPV